MATSGATLIDALARRLRDTSNTAHPRDLLRRILSQSQRALNLNERVRRKTTATFTTSVRRTLYRTSEIASDVARIERIRFLDRTLPETDWRSLVDNSRTWYRDVADRPYTWARIGSTLWVLTPITRAPITVEVVYITVPADLVDGATLVDFPDEFIPLLVDLAEGVVLLKARLYHAMDGPMSRLAAMMPQKPGASVPSKVTNI